MYICVYIVIISVYVKLKFSIHIEDKLNIQLEYLHIHNLCVDFCICCCSAIPCAFAISRGKLYFVPLYITCIQMKLSLLQTHHVQCMEMHMLKIPVV